MGEIKIFGYIIVATLFLSAIVMPLVEIFFAYRERLMLSDALYNSCRVAAEASINYWDISNINAAVYEHAFDENFGNTFATSFGLSYLGKTGNTLKFKGNEAYNDFEVVLLFEEKYSESHGASYDKTITSVSVEATSPYKYKISFMQSLNDNAHYDYLLRSERKYFIEVFN